MTEAGDDVATEIGAESVNLDSGNADLGNDSGDADSVNDSVNDVVDAVNEVAL
jgi:hypothetical protein